MWVRMVASDLPTREMNKNHGCLGYREVHTSQLCGDYFINHYIYTIYKDPYETTRMTHGKSPTAEATPRSQKTEVSRREQRCSTSRGKGGHPAWEATVWR